MQSGGRRAVIERIGAAATNSYGLATDAGQQSTRRFWLGIDAASLKKALSCMASLSPLMERDAQGWRECGAVAAAS